jgi:hypothetical protein
MLNIIQTRSYTIRLRKGPNSCCSGLRGVRSWRWLLDLGSRARLTSRFERIENVKNFDVEKWYSFNFLFTESFKWACVKENANENDFCLRLQSVVVKMMLGAWKIKLF